MMRPLLTAAVLTTAVHAALAGDVWQGDNRFSFGATLGYNIKLSSKNLQAPPPNPGPATGAQADRFYDNGFVRVDVSDNAGGYTTWWGFDTAQGATYDGLPGGAVTLSSTQSPAQGETFQSDGDPQAGFEFGYARRLLRCGDADNPWMIVGLEARCLFLDLNITETSSLTGNATTTDTYNLAPGNIVLGGSYQGSFLGLPPGPLLGSEPVNRAFTSGTASLEHRLRGQLYGFNLGPVFEVPLFPSTMLIFSGGWALAGVVADDHYQETATLGAGAPVVTGGSAHFDSWQGGLYARGMLAVDLGRQWQAQAGVQWQDTGSMTETSGQYETHLDFGDTLLITFGLGFSF